MCTGTATNIHVWIGAWTCRQSLSHTDGQSIKPTYSPLSQRTRQRILQNPELHNQDWHDGLVVLVVLLLCDLHPKSHRLEIQVPFSPCLSLSLPSFLVFFFLGLFPACAAASAVTTHSARERLRSQTQKHPPSPTKKEEEEEEKYTRGEATTRERQPAGL